MSETKVINQLLGIEGWEIRPDGIDILDDVVIIKIRPVAGNSHFCHCGRGALFVYDHQPVRRVRDFPVFGRKCFLEFEPARIDCSNCGVVVEKLDWLDRNERQTLRYGRYVAALCNILPVLDVADLEGLNKNKVYRIDRKWLLLREQERQIQPVKNLGIDEIALRKGHVYATVFYDLDKHEVIGLVKSRTEKAVNTFFRRMGKQWCKKVKAVCMDLWKPFLKSVRRHCKKAVVVFDKFHVYKYLSEAIDQVRRNEMNDADEEGRKLIKGSRWLWLKNKLNKEQRQTIEEIMALNNNLALAYILKEDFSRFYQCGGMNEAIAFLKEWTGRCIESNLKPFMKLAKRLNKWREGIASYFKYRITNGISEGINNKIKVIKRRSYGFHDEIYFFLKILNITNALPSMSSIHY